MTNLATNQDYLGGQNDFTMQCPATFDIGAAVESAPVVVREKCRCRGAILSLITDTTGEADITLFKNGAITVPVILRSVPTATGPATGENGFYVNFESDTDDAGGGVRFDVGDRVSLSSDGVGAAAVTTVVFIMRTD